MAGIGFELRKIYGRKTLASSIKGSIYATMTTMGPSVLFAVLLLTLRAILDYKNTEELENIFFISSFTYVFLTAILVSSVFNTVLSRYISDCIFVKKEDDLCASVFGSLTGGTIVTGVIMLIMCFLMYKEDNIPISFLVLFYSLGVLATIAYILITFVSALKQYKEVTLSYFVGVTVAILLFLWLSFGVEINDVMGAYIALVCGFLLTDLFLIYACLKAFGYPSEKYFQFLSYFKLYPKLMISGYSYMLGFYISSIIYWLFSDMNIKVSIFRTTPNFDMAIFLAIVVNMPALVIFVVKVETAFFDKYVNYLSALNSGNYSMIEKEKEHMSNIIRLQLFFVYEVQLIIVVLLICLANVFFPYLGISSQVLNMFMVLGIGIYCVCCMYFTIIFLYYFEDHTSAYIAPCIFLGIVIVLSLVATRLGNPFYPIPLLAGGVIGWIVAFLKLKYRLKNLNAFLMCK